MKQRDATADDVRWYLDSIRDDLLHDLHVRFSTTACGTYSITLTTSTSCESASQKPRTLWHDDDPDLEWL